MWFNIYTPSLFVYVGQAIVQEKFSVTVDKKKVFVAGCKCLKGTLLKNKLYKLVRDRETLIEGEHYKYI